MRRDASSRRKCSSLRVTLTPAHVNTVTMLFKLLPGLLILHQLTAILALPNDRGSPYARISVPHVPGADVLSVVGVELHDVSLSPMPGAPTLPSNLSVCKVNVTLSHPGLNDSSLVTLMESNGVGNLTAVTTQRRRFAVKAMVSFGFVPWKQSTVRWVVLLPARILRLSSAARVAHARKTVHAAASNAVGLRLRVVLRMDFARRNQLPHLQNRVHPKSPLLQRSPHLRCHRHHHNRQLRVQNLRAVLLHSRNAVGSMRDRQQAFQRAAIPLVIRMGTPFLCCTSRTSRERRII